jgi:asparagine synthase (glutamine-hydrolysing)
MSFISEADRQALYTPAFKRELGGYSAREVFNRHAERANTDDPLALIQYIDTHTYLVGDINTKVDRASMAHSLEVREPLMDHELVEWLATLPSSIKLRGSESKFLLKKAMEPAMLRRLVEQHESGARDFSTPLWTLLMYDAFLRNVMGQPARAPMAA